MAGCCGRQKKNKRIVQQSQKTCPICNSILSKKNTYNSTGKKYVTTYYCINKKCSWRSK